jgi:hypothetical protein
LIIREHRILALDPSCPIFLMQSLSLAACIAEYVFVDEQLDISLALAEAVEQHSRAAEPPVETRPDSPRRFVALPSFRQNVGMSIRLLDGRCHCWRRLDIVASAGYLAVGHNVLAMQ